jgi:TatD DNase family protein
LRLCLGGVAADSLKERTERHSLSARRAAKPQSEQLVQKTRRCLFVTQSFADTQLIDSHAHIDGPEFDADREEVIERARAKGVKTILNVGTGDPHTDDFERAIDLGNRYDFILASIGTHPHDARHYDDLADEKTRQLIKQNSSVIAWGEIGLDFHYDNSPRDVQKRVFARQLRSAMDLNLPVIIHTREAEIETVEILKSEYATATQRGVFHCFSGSLELATTALDLGFYISFSGIVTFKKADDLRGVAKYVPSDRLLIETDCPFLAPIPFRGKRNEPAYVVEVANCIAETRRESLDEIETSTTLNFSRCFGLTSS